jgi:hypothetical protein
MSEPKPPPPVTTRVVDIVAADIKKSSPSMSSEQARSIAIESARRVDRQQRERKSP